MQIPRIYLETTIFYFYFEKERKDHADTVKLFEAIKAGKYQAFTSMYVLRELQSEPAEKKNKMLALVEEYNIAVLDFSAEAEELADGYVQALHMFPCEGITISKYVPDSIHAAVAAVNDMDLVVSLNFKNIVRKKTIELTELVNTRKGYRKVGICAPAELR